MNGRVLDLGSATNNLNEFQSMGSNIEEYIAGDLVPSNELDLQLDGTKLPLKTGTFDTIILSEVLEHIPITKVQSLIEECYRVLSPGGRLIGHVPFFYPYHPGPTDTWRPTHQSIRNLLTDAGFDNLVITREGSYPETILSHIYHGPQSILKHLQDNSSMNITRLGWGYAPIHYIMKFVTILISQLLPSDSSILTNWYISIGFSGEKPDIQQP